MSKTHKTLIIILAFIGPLMIFGGLLIKLEHWSVYIHKSVLFTGYLITALAVALAVKFLKSK